MRTTGNAPDEVPADTQNNVSPDILLNDVQPDTWNEVSADTSNDVPADTLLNDVQSDILN